MLASGGVISLPGVARVWGVLPEARVVGGAVRDMLAGRQVDDVDFAVPLSPDEVMARAKSAGVRSVPTGLAHGTVTLLVEGRGFEVTSLRRDIETDGRHARVVFTDDWEEDAARRDFTFNAMSCDQHGKIFDYFGGQADLAAGMVRFVGVAQTRITEDYLRILRFFRFFARYGRGEADSEAITAISLERAGLLGLSCERVWSEIKKILQAPAPLMAIELMRRCAVLDVVLPGAVVARLGALLAQNAPVDPLLRLAALTDEDLAGRLRLSKAEAQTLASWRAPFLLRADADDDELRRALADYSKAALIGQSWLNSGEETGGTDLRARLTALKTPVFPLLGRDLVGLGIKAGPRMGSILTLVRRWWWEGGCMADQAACLAQATRISEYSEEDK